MFTPADELLVCCARVSQNVETQARLSQLVREPLDWPYVLSKSWWHRVRPLVHRHLSSLPAELIPDEVLKELLNQATELAARNLRLASALTEVAGMFEQRQLRMLVFKGPTLSEDAYGNLGLRECGDLDMLVHPDDVPSVQKMLVENGFTSAWDQLERKRQAFGCEFLRNGTELDVHWDLAPGWFNYRVDFDRLWTAGTGLETSFTFARKLSPENAVLVLCIHGTKHWWERLRWICDIAELVNSSPGMHWDRVYAGAERANARRTVELGLRLAADLLSAKLPEHVSQHLNRSPVAQRQSSQVIAWLARGESGAAQRRLRERFLFRLRLCERARDRLPQLVHYLWAAPQG
jgi:hypothetical protein